MNFIYKPRFYFSNEGKYDWMPIIVHPWDDGRFSISILGLINTVIRPMGKLLVAVIDEDTKQPLKMRLVSYKRG